MAINDSEQLLINDGSKTETITISQIRDGSMLNDTDKFLVNDGTKTETITWEQLSDELGPQGIVNKPTVLKPNDGAGSGDIKYLKSDPITTVEGGGVDVCETDLISNVTTELAANQGGWAINFVCRDTGNNALVEWELLGNPPGTTSLEVAQKAFNGDPTDMARGQRGPSGQYAYGSFEPSGGYTINNTLGINNNVYSYFYWILELGGVTAKLELEDYDGDTDNPDQKYQWLSTSAFAGQTISASNPLKIKCFTLNDLQENTTVAAIRVDGQLLIDSAFPIPEPDEDNGMLAPTTFLEFPSSDGFDCFDVGAVVQPPDVKILSKDADASPPTIAVDGGSWLGSDGSGEPDSDTKLVKETPYDTTLTVEGPTGLTDAFVGESWMADGAGAPGPYSQSPYKLTTSQITNVNNTDPASVVLTFADPCPDLQYLKTNDVIQTTPDEVKVIAPPDIANRRLTVDGGNWDPAGVTGDDHVEYQTNGGQGTVVSVDPVNYKILLQDTGDRDNRWIAENQAATEFAVAGPQYLDAPLLTTDVELESTEFATTPFGIDGLKEIIWDLNGIERSAGTLNPYKPPGLAINTTYNVKVKHVGAALGESEWSTPSFTFTTGASRSLKEHYVKQIRELQSALEAAEAKPKRGQKKAD